MQGTYEQGVLDTLKHLNYVLRTLFEEAMSEGSVKPQTLADALVVIKLYEEKAKERQHD